MNLELKLLQRELDGKNKIIQSLETENDTQIEQSNSVGWFSYTETKLLLGLLFLLTLLQLMRLFQGKSTETSKADSLLGVDDEFADIDPVEIKMDLAKSLIEDNDFSGAREILIEIISDSGADGIEKAEALLKSIAKTICSGSKFFLISSKKPSLNIDVPIIILETPISSISNASLIFLIPPPTCSLRLGICNNFFMTAIFN